MSNTLQALRTRAIQQSLFSPTNLKAAVRKLGFVQADPIRSPARAQDLILRHRVREYKAGDLERRYAALDIEEDLLYAYGFVHRRVWELLHPRQPVRLSVLEKKVFDAVRRSGETHPSTLEQHFGRECVVNDWGGYSKATTRALEHLHYRGLLRVARRDNGIRVYEASGPCTELPPSDRLRKLILTMANVLAPVPIRTLHTNIARYKRLGNPRAAVRHLISAGDLETQIVEELEYAWPTQKITTETAPPVVRFMAPFDPLVWDRLRFEHLWGWAYRFEAYTPPAKRLRSYYAMPLLWGDDVIGWANANVCEGKLDVDFGFVKKRPRDAGFRQALEEEYERLRLFLGTDSLT